MTFTAADLDTRLTRFSTYDTTPAEAYALFDEARAAGRSAFWSDREDGRYVLLDYVDVKAALADWRTFSSTPAVLRPLVSRPRYPPIEFDPPELAQWREILTPALNRHAPDLHRDEVRADAARILDGLVARAAFDLHDDYALELPLLGLCHLIGFDADKRADIRRHTIELYASAGEPARAAAAARAFGEFGAREVYARLEHPREDFLTTLAHARIGDHPLTAEELGATMLGILNAGHATTVSGLTSLIHEVLTRPELKARLLDEPDLIPAAVSESMRLHTPFFGLYRMTTRDVTVAGVDIPQGSSVQVMWAAANRDPKVFPNPAEFDVDRTFGRDQPLSFGFGVHACMGQPMARMEMQVGLAELLARMPEVELADPGSVRYVFSGSETASIKSLPARLPTG